MLVARTQGQLVAAKYRAHDFSPTARVACMPQPSHGASLITHFDRRTGYLLSMGRMSRAKGTRGEQEVATRWREADFDVHRVPNSGGLRTKGDYLGVDGLHGEVKIGERLNVKDALAQAIREAPPGDMPSVAFRWSSRHESTDWFMAVRLDDFIALWRAAWGPPEED